MLKKIISLVVSVLLFLFVGLFNYFSFAERIILHSGETIEGKIVEETGTDIRIQDSAGFLNKYSLFEVESILSDEDDKQKSFNQEEELLDEMPKGGVPKDVKSLIRNNLVQTEAMIKNTLKQLYPLDTEEGQQDEEEVTETNSLKNERDKKYQKYKKYY